MWMTRLTQKIELFATKSKLVYFLVSFYYRQMVKREAHLANISKVDRVLCIGGGMCPYTAILLHEYTNAEVTVIDNDHTCIEKSRHFLADRGLDNIHVFHSDGSCVNCQEYTVIHIAMQISPKETVIDSIIKKARNGARVLVRMPKDGLEDLYSSVSKGHFNFDRQIKHGPFSNVDNTSISIVQRSDALVAI